MFVVRVISVFGSLENASSTSVSASPCSEFSTVNYSKSSLICATYRQVEVKLGRAWCQKRGVKTPVEITCLW